MGKVLQTKGTADAKVLRRNKYGKVMSGLGQSEMCAEAESLKALVVVMTMGFDMILRVTGSLKKKFPLEASL